MPNLRVGLISIRNIMGIEELVFEPGAFTVVEGENGTGKTSVLEAIRAVVDGGHDATLIRNGAERGEVVLVLSDGVEFAKLIGQERSTLTVRHPQMGELKKPQAYVKRLVDALAFNPVEFLTASSARQMEILLETLPLRLADEDVDLALAGVKLPHRVSFEGHALQVIDRVGKVVYEERTGVNRAAREKRATAAQLAQSLPQNGASAPPVDVAALRAEQERVREQREARVRELDGEYNAAAAEINADADAAVEKIRRDQRERVAAVLAEGVRAVRAAEDAAAPELERLAGEISAADERARQATAEANTRRMLRQMEAEATDRETASEALTAALARLEALKGNLLSALPIPGVEVRDGEIYQGDVPLRRLNTAARVKLALTLAQIRAGDAELPLVCVDGLELLDAKTFEVFRQKAPQAGLQLVVTRVGADETLTVTTEGGR